MDTRIDRGVLSIMAILWLIAPCMVAIEVIIEVNGVGSTGFDIRGQSNIPVVGLNLFLRKDSDCTPLIEYNVTAATGGQLGVTPKKQDNEVRNLDCLPVLVASVLINNYVSIIRFNFFQETLYYLVMRHGRR